MNKVLFVSPSSSFGGLAYRSISLCHVLSLSPLSLSLSSLSPLCTHTFRQHKEGHPCCKKSANHSSIFRTHVRGAAKVGLQCDDPFKRAISAVRSFPPFGVENKISRQVLLLGCTCTELVNDDPGNFHCTLFPGRMLSREVCFPDNENTFTPKNLCLSFVLRLEGRGLKGLPRSNRKRRREGEDKITKVNSLASLCVYLIP